MISVVIPTHNRKSTIKRAINSAANQTIKDIEIIVVSDGSTDGTNELVKEISKSDDRVRLISYRDSRGGNYARNTGAQAATSELIAFLDDDDEWLPEKLEKQISVFSNKKNIGLVYTGVNIIYENGGYRYSVLPSYKGDLSREILIHNFIPTTSSVMIRKTVLEAAGFFDIELSALQDYDLWIRCCQITHVCCIELPLVNYYINPCNGQIIANTDKRFRAREQIEDKYQDLYRILNAEENRERLCNKYCGLAMCALNNDEYAKCRRYALQAFNWKHGIKPAVIYISSFLGIKNVLKIRRLLKR